MSLLSNTAIKKILSETQTWSASQNYQDDAKLLFGESAGDLEVYHDGTNSYIKEDGTGDLIFLVDNKIIFQDDEDSDVTLFDFDTSARTFVIGATSDEVATTLNGNVGISGDFTITNASSNNVLQFQRAGNLILTSYDAGDGAKPLIKLVRNSSSPADNDLIGEIVFNGEDDLSNSQDYAKIETKLLDVSNGSEDSDMRFYTMKNGTETERLRVSNNGVNYFGTLTGTGNYTLSKDGGSEIELTATTSSSNSLTNLIRFTNETGGSGIRGQGLMFTDSDMTNEEWFIGTPYSASFNMVQIGFARDNSVLSDGAEYQAQAIAQFIDNGTTKSVQVLDNTEIQLGSESGGDSQMYHDGTCLLYTSPSPRDVEESRMPSSA